jgi:hypothetical protein
VGITGARVVLSAVGVILFDKRGQGLSDRVPEDRLPTLEQRMDDVHGYAVGPDFSSGRTILRGLLRKSRPARFSASR